MKYDGLDDKEQERMFQYTEEVIAERRGRRIGRKNILSELLHGLSFLYEDAISDKYIVGIYEEYTDAWTEGGQIKAVEPYYDKASRIMDLLPEDQQEPSWRSIREAGAASRKQGFLEGFRKACSVFKNMDMEAEQNGKTVPYAGGCGRGHRPVTG